MVAAPNPQHELEFCTECGDFVESLNSLTGWCNECSRQMGYIAPSCASCGAELANSNNGKLCSHCKYVGWLERNADAIERVMAVQGVHVRIAIKIVRASNRPTCQSCGQPIIGGQRGRHSFCKKNPECIKGHNVFEYHLRSKPREEALNLAITASRIFKLTAAIADSKPRKSL